MMLMLDGAQVQTSQEKLVLILPMARVIVVLESYRFVVALGK
jgi:hypothetical protein